VPVPCGAASRETEGPQDVINASDNRLAVETR
jgi:hypothetical protein